MVSARAWIHNRTTGHPVEFHRLRAAAGDIVCLAIVLSVVPSFKSVRFQQGVLLDAVRTICAAQPGFSASSTIYV